MVAAVYEFTVPTELRSINTYTHALRQCLLRHPQLSSTVVDAGTNSSYYAFCPSVDLRQHVQILEQVEAHSEVSTMADVIPQILDASWSLSSPPWKVTVLPFSNTKCFIAFSYSHGLADGLSGMAFHKSLLENLQNSGQGVEDEKDIEPVSTIKSPVAAFDTSTNLPISFSFLLAPLIGTYLPKTLATMLLGSKAYLNPVTPGTWIGRPPFYEAEQYSSAVELVSINDILVCKALETCRKHGTKMTGLLHQLIASALSESLPPMIDIDNFVATTVISLRRAADISDHEMGNFVSNSSHVLAKRQTTDAVQGIDWNSARQITEQLAAVSTRLKDVPVGLLRYLRDVRSWLLGKLGQPRDSSYELSNLGNFEVSYSTPRCCVTGMMMSQPGDVTGAPLSFNVCSVKNNPLTLSINWQLGALNLGSTTSEKDFVRKVGESIVKSFQTLD